MKKRNHLILLMLTVTALSFAVCGSRTDNTENIVDNVENVQTLEYDTINVSDSSTLDNSTVNNSTEDSSIMDSSATLEDSSNITESTETDESAASEASVEENITEEPAVEMVDFETWAKQEGNEEVCLVVWNEELGVQTILLEFEETMEKYQIQTGDKFAIPYNPKIVAIIINLPTSLTEYSSNHLSLHAFSHYFLPQLDLPEDNCLVLNPSKYLV